MYLVEERRKRILEEVIAAGSVYVGDLAKKYAVTYETIRKDLTFLEQKGLLIKTHGGAMLKQGAIEYSFQARKKENNPFKRDIAKKALEFIPPNSALIIGTGSSNYELANLLVGHSGLKIFTDSLPVASVLIESDNQVFLFGGELRKKSASVFGGWAASMINDIYVDVCFIGTDGFNNMSGPTTPSSSDAFLDRAIIAHAKKRYILGDYTKFQRSSLFKICDWSEITALITNDVADRACVAAVAQYTTVVTC